MDTYSCLVTPGGWTVMFLVQSYKISPTMNYDNMLGNEITDFQSKKQRFGVMGAGC